MSGGTLAVRADQTVWDDRQQAALAQLGVSDASPGDLAVFLHYAQRTGLDPFARQIYMIGRLQKTPGGGSSVRWTIQTSIDGLRVIARRAADKAGETLEYDDTVWCGRDGRWRDVWLDTAPPAASKVVVRRAGCRFSAVARYDAYVQTFKSGDRGDRPTTFWARMPDVMLAKTAEALALRKAFPHDLSGVYTDDEMGSADEPAAAVARPSRVESRGRRHDPAGNEDIDPALKARVVDLGTRLKLVTHDGDRLDVSELEGDFASMHDGLALRSADTTTLRAYADTLEKRVAEEKQAAVS